MSDAARPCTLQQHDHASRHVRVVRPSRVASRKTARRSMAPLTSRPIRDHYRPNTRENRVLTMIKGKENHHDDLICEICKPPSPVQIRAAPPIFWFKSFNFPSDGSDGRLANGLQRTTDNYCRVEPKRCCRRRRYARSTSFGVQLGSIDRTMREHAVKGYRTSTRPDTAGMIRSASERM